MASQNSFDVVSRIDVQEVKNAILIAMKEVKQRFDFKGSASLIELKAEEIELRSDDEFKLKSLIAILEEKLVKRDVPLKGLVYGPVEKALGGTVRQKASLVQGIPIEKAREIVKAVKTGKYKSQASIQGDVVRISGKDRDELQVIIQMLKSGDFGIPLQFINYRSN
jgi:cyclic-di-GMP-binding protein